MPSTIPATVSVNLYLNNGRRTCIFLLISGAMLILNGISSFFIPFANNFFYHLFWAGGMILCTGSIGAKPYGGLASRAALRHFFGFCVMAILASIAGVILSVMTILAALHRYGTDMKFGMNVAVIVWYTITIIALFRAIYIYAQVSKYLRLGTNLESRNELSLSSCQSRNQYVSPPTYDQVANGAVITDTDKDEETNVPNQSSTLPPTYSSIEAFSKASPQCDAK